MNTELRIIDRELKDSKTYMNEVQVVISMHKMKS